MLVQGSPMFGLWRDGFSIEAAGRRRNLTGLLLGGLDEALAGHFAALGAGDGPGVVVGGLPFDRAAAPLLYQPESAVFRSGAATVGSLDRRDLLPLPAPLKVTGDPDAAGYAAMVRRALAAMADPARAPLAKVVLARRLQVAIAGALDPLALVARLARDPSVTTFLLDLSSSSGEAGHMLAGATPELLVSRKGLAVASHPLAGSAPRRSDVAADRAAADGLLGSAKDQREHRLVVEAILDQLAPLCATLAAPEVAALRSTASMWHLGTRIEGRLKHADMPSAAGLAALLHPTPAVGGFPRAAALELIDELEAGSRGFYAGAVGWSDAQGDGEWHVALRCAELRPGRLTLHAGAGIVEGSVPEAEAAETLAKFAAILQVLGMQAEDELMECVA